MRKAYLSIIKKLLAGKCFRTTNDFKNLTGNGSLSCLVVFKGKICF